MAPKNSSLNTAFSGSPKTISIFRGSALAIMTSLVLNLRSA